MSLTLLAATAATAGSLIVGQVAAPMGLSSWTGVVANLSAVGLMGFILYTIVLKQQPKERAEARKEREEERTEVRKERAEAREYTERILNMVAEEYRLDRAQRSEQLSQCGWRSGG